MISYELPAHSGVELILSSSADEVEVRTQSELPVELRFSQLGDPMGAAKGRNVAFTCMVKRAISCSCVVHNPNDQPIRVVPTHDPLGTDPSRPGLCRIAFHASTSVLRYKPVVYPTY